MVTPITPKQVTDAKRESMPDAVVEAFNAAIAAAWNGRSATVKQDAVALSIADALQIPKSEVYAKGFLDVEDIFRKAGWKVKYDKPGYNETYPATFEFSK